MNPVVKKLWLKDLRDTKCPWVQGAGLLMGPGDDACCLGVVTDIAVREGIVPPWKWDEEKCEWAVNGEEAVLPKAVMKWAKLDCSNPLVKYTAPDGTVIEDVEMSQLNDGGIKYVDGVHYKIPIHTFAQIADIIEEQL